jgi:hypothetical protein
MSEDSSKPPAPESTETQSSHWSSPFEELLKQETVAPLEEVSLGVGPIRLANPIIGTPEQDGISFPGQQSYPDTCAIRCQEFVLEEFTGQHFDENALVNEAEQNGWYKPGEGTRMEDVGNLLELHGIAVNRYREANIFNLASELAQGHKVIIGVDSDDLWQNPVLNPIQDQLNLQGADHAVVVSGIDTSDPSMPHVMVSDPGTGQAIASYPMDQFLNAWKESGFYMVATQEPVPSHLPEMANFDYEAGHIPNVSLPDVGEITYDQFQQIESHPDMWHQIVSAGHSIFEPLEKLAELFGGPLLHETLALMERDGLETSEHQADHYAASHHAPGQADSHEGHRMSLHENHFMGIDHEPHPQEMHHEQDHLHLDGPQHLDDTDWHK